MGTAAVSDERITELLAPFLGPVRLSPTQTRQVSNYLDLLLLWNSKMNLTAVRDPEEIVSRHFGESFFAARHVFSRKEVGSSNQNLADGTNLRSAIDIGSGAGFPGLPFKIFHPELDLTLIDSNQKKVAFLREVVRTLDLKSVNVFANRADKFGKRADLVSLRAVERFENILPIAMRLVAPAGQLVLLIGSAQVETAIRLLPNLRWAEAIPIPISHGRVVLIGHSE